MSKLTTAAQINAAAKRALNQIEHGTDAAVRVGGWVRTLAAEEAKGGGDLDRAIGLRGEPGWGDVTREAFGSLYGLGTEGVSAEEAPAGSDWMREALGQAKSLPEWVALQARSEGDAWASGIATAAALDVLAETLPELPKEDAAALQEQLEFLGELSGEKGASPKHLERVAKVKRRIAMATQQSAAAAQGVREKAASIRSAMRRGAAKATQEIEEAAAGMAGLGVGSDPGTRSRVTAPRQEVLQALRSNAKLKRIAAIAGRLRSQAVRKQAEKCSHARSELADIVTGSDVARLLPSEMVLLADDETELLFYARLAEGRCLQYELRGKETQTRGPIILAIDESGSMAGSRDEWAKGVALALAEIAARQDRAFVVLHFDTQVSHVQEFPNPKQLPWEAVLDLATHFSGGGTCIAAPLIRAHAMIEAAKSTTSKLGKSDVILITDGEDGDDLTKPIGDLRALGASVYGFAIDSDFSDHLTGLLDGAERIDGRDLGVASAKLDAVFSI